MIIKLLSYIPAIIGVLIIGLVIYSNDSKSLKNKLFATVNIFIGLWLSFLLIADTTSDPQLALWFFKAGLISSQLTILFFYYFSLVFPFHSKINLKLQTVISLPMIAICVLLLTPLGIGSVIINNFGVTAQNTGLVYNISDYLTLTYLLISMALIVAKYGKSNVIQKKQIKSVIIGLVIATLANVFSNIIVFNSSIGQNYKFFGNFSIFIFSLFVAYAILKHHLFNVRLLVARSVAYTLSLIVVVALFILLSLGIATTLPIGLSFSTSEIIFFASFSIVAALAFQPVKRYFDKASNKLFYRDAYDTQALLNNINSSIVSTPDLHKLLEATAREIKTNIKASFCNFYINNKAVIDFHAVGTHTPLFDEEKWGSLSKSLDTSHSKIFSEEHGLDERTSQIMHDLKTEAILRLTSQNQKVGYLVVGQKQSGSSFTAQDAQILEIIADEVAIAVQNTLRYEEIALFNVTLQQKIKNATAELQHTNQKLKALDEAKDEFISMASHQLRTPLTSVKGYLSMLLEGDGGKLNDQQRRFLDQAFISSQRMVYLIADLLNVSRLKTGKFVIEAKPTYLPDLVESELAQLYETAKARGLELIFAKPKEFCTLNLDETKIRQVIMNFSDNAIHYTPKGGKITVELRQSDESVEFTVTDTGIGVPKSEVHKLFTKFYRAGNARKARPDGTGLGIFMAKKVVAVQGGAIIFKTEEGKGSTFGFTFPRAKLEVAATEK